MASLANGKQQDIDKGLFVGESLDAIYGLSLIHIYFLQHIKIDTLVYGNVLCLALKGLFAERPAVEAHIVEVLSLIHI